MEEAKDEKNQNPLGDWHQKYPEKASFKDAGKYRFGHPES